MSCYGFLFYLMTNVSRAASQLTAAQIYTASEQCSVPCKDAILMQQMDFDQLNGCCDESPIKIL